MQRLILMSINYEKVLIKKMHNEIDYNTKQIRKSNPIIYFKSIINYYLISINYKILDIFICLIKKAKAKS